MRIRPLKSPAQDLSKGRAPLTHAKEGAGVVGGHPAATVGVKGAVPQTGEGRFVGVAEDDQPSTITSMPTEGGQGDSPSGAA